MSYELARSASEVLTEHGIFGHCERQGDRLERYLRDILNRPCFEPRKLDGERRRYRYPRRKASLLRQADAWVRVRAPSGLLQALMERGRESERRRWLCECPGVGPKTASWLLRNVGLGNGLAILDVHILRALEGAGRAERYILPRDYEAVELSFLAWSKELGAPPAAFDLFLWEHGRGAV